MDEKSHGILITFIEIRANGAAESLMFDDPEEALGYFKLFIESENMHFLKARKGAMRRADFDALEEGAFK